MNLRPFCLLLGFVLLGTNPVLAGYTYKEDDTRLVNGVLYDINGDPVTGTYEVFYENQYSQKPDALCERDIKRRRFPI